MKDCAQKEVSTLNPAFDLVLLRRHDALSFVVQVVTGILLLYYRPSAENAFESVQFIVTEVQFGWLIRSIHSWSANLMIATLFIHLFSVFSCVPTTAARDDVGQWSRSFVHFDLFRF